MTAELIMAGGEHYSLPVLSQWEMEYGCGTPCDSFHVVCPWNCGNDEILAHAVRFRAWEGGQTVFTGVVDECEVTWSGQGARLEISGRGLAALLLDNEAEGMDYELATVQDILRDHVLRYGILVSASNYIPPVEHFPVSSGSSEWSVLYRFARYHAGITPRFDREGQLILSDWDNGEIRVIHDRIPVLSLKARDRRYGVLSEVWVRDRGAQSTTQKVINETFKTDGGQCRRLFTMPTKSNHQAMRYQGEYQLRQSKRDLLCLEVVIALPFCAWPGDLIRLERSGWGRNGLWRVAQSAVSMDEQGYRTKLELVPPQTLL